MVETNDINQNNNENDFNNFSTEELLELYNNIEEHIKYLNNNILQQEDEQYE